MLLETPSSHTLTDCTVTCQKITLAPDVHHDPPREHHLDLYIWVLCSRQGTSDAAASLTQLACDSIS